MAAEALAIEPPPSSYARMGPRRNWGKPIALVLFLMLVVALVAVNFIPLDPRPFEAAAEARLGQPVKIGSVRFNMVPTPSLRFERVAIGADGEVKLASVKASPELGSIVGEKKVFRSVELEGVNAPLAWMGAAIWGKPGPDTMRIDRVIAKKVKPDSAIAIAPFDVDARLAPDGTLKNASITEHWKPRGSPARHYPICRFRWSPENSGKCPPNSLDA